MQARRWPSPARALSSPSNVDGGARAMIEIDLLVRAEFLYPVSPGMPVILEKATAVMVAAGSCPSPVHATATA